MIMDSKEVHTKIKNQFLINEDLKYYFLWTQFPEIAQEIFG